MVGKAKGSTEVNQRSAAIIIGLVLLTLVGFILVSNLLGAKGVTSNKGGSPVPSPKPTSRPAQPAISPLPSPKLSQAEGQMHTDLVRAQELLGNILAAIEASDWTAAQQAFAEFASKRLRLPAPQLRYPDISPVLQDFFDLYEVQLERAIAEQNAQQAAIALNQLYGIVGEQRARVGTRGVPIEFQRLRFLVREVGLWSQAGDDRMLRVRTLALREAWTKDVRPIITARRNGSQAIRNFDQLVQRLSSIEQTQEFAALVPEFNKELDLMDNLFQRPPRSPGASGSPGKSSDEE
jgi:hypothetical protein